MGLFGKKKKPSLVQEINRDVQLGRELTDSIMQRSGIDAATLQQMEAAAQQPGLVQQAMAYRDRLARLVQHGVDTPAAVRSVQAGETSPLLGGPTVRVGVTVSPAAGAPYEASTEQVMAESMLAALSPGAQLTVKVDPSDPATVMIWGVGPPSPAPADPASGAERLAKLQALLDQGALTQEEFDQAKAKFSP
jgi:hypothetical protein